MDPTDDSPLPSSPTNRRSPEHWLFLGLALIGVLALVGLGALVQPDERGHGTHEKLGLPPCLPMKFWGVPCPGCGVTTSVTLAAHGDVGASIATQPFGFLVFLAIPIFGLWALLAHVRGRDLGTAAQRVRLGKWVLWPASAMLAAWIYKLVQVFASPH